MTDKAIIHIMGFTGNTQNTHRFSRFNIIKNKSVAGLSLFFSPGVMWLITRLRVSPRLPSFTLFIAAGVEDSALNLI